MSSISAPFGLKPLYHPSGNVRPKASSVASGFATALFQYTPVSFTAGNTGLQAAGTTGPAVGTFCGVEFTPSDGRRRYSNNWPASQVATQIVAYYTEDEEITYEIQADGSVSEVNVGNQANVNAETGNTTTGFSTISLATAGLTSSGNAFLRVVGLALYPNNAWGDAFTIVQAQIANHSYRATRAAV